MKQRIAGAFELIQPLSRGGMGVIWEGKHLITSTRVAIKVISSEPGSTNVARMLKFRKMFRAEVRATARLNHPNIVQILDYGQMPVSIVPLDGLSPRAPYYVMPLTNASSLQDYRPDDWASLLALLTQLLRGLAHAHAHKVIHRDIKPSNVLVHRSDSLRFILTDFGIAYAADPDKWLFASKIGRGSASGTPHYMAPEQFRGTSREFGPWTDLYAVGILAFKMVTGRLPFQGSSVRELGKDHLTTPVPSIVDRCLFPVPDLFESWLWRMTAKSPLDRTRNAADAIADLLSFADAPLNGATVTVESSEATVDTQSQMPPTLEVAKFQPLQLPVFSRPTMPQHWRELDYLFHKQPLSGVGLGLFGLRRFPIMGRESERDTMWRQLHLCRENRDVRAVVLSGVRGVGKSGLMDWLCHLALESGVAEVLRDGPRDEGRQDRGLVGLLQPYFQTAGLSTREIERIVREELAKLGGLSGAMVRVLTSVLESESAAKRSMAQIPAAQTLESVARFLGHVAMSRTLIVSIDDAHFNPVGRSLVMQTLEDSVPHQGILFVLSVTEDENSEGSVGPMLEHPRTEQIHVSPMESAHVREMIHAVAQLPDSQVDEIVRRSEGSPLFAVQLVNDWVQRGVFKAVGGRIVVAQETPTLPSTIAQLWAARVDSFVEASSGRAVAKTQFCLLATLGKESSLEEVTHVFSIQALGDADEFIDHAARYNLVFRTEGGVQLAHGLLRDAVLEGLEDAVAVELHETCAVALCDRYPESSPAMLMRQATHWLAAQRFERAFQSMEQACLHARRTYDVGSLMSWTQRWIKGLEASPKDLARPRYWVQALSLRSYAFLLGSGTDDLSQAVRLVREAKAWAEKSEDDDLRLIAVTQWALSTLYTGDTASGLEGLEPLIEACEDADICAQANITLSRLYASQGDTHEVIRVAELALESAQDETLKIQGYQVLARGYLELDRLDEATEWIGKAIELTQTRGYLVAEARSHQTQAFIQDARGDFAGAESSHRAALELFELAAPRTGYPLAEREFVARALLAQRDFDQASEVFREVAILLARKIGFKQNIYDGLLACAAAQRDWKTFDGLFEAATTYDFRPSNLNVRALEIALEMIDDAERSARLSSRLESLQ